MTTVGLKASPTNVFKSFTPKPKGAGVTVEGDTPKEKAEALAAVLEEKYPDCEVEVNNGGQPIYYYIISVE
mgnify:CR=1 FL=1